MLNVNDMDFIIGVLDQGTYKGMQTTMKANEVFLKLNRMKEAQAEAAEAAAAAKVKEALEEKKKNAKPKK